MQIHYSFSNDIEAFNNVGEGEGERRKKKPCEGVQFQVFVY